MLGHAFRSLGVVVVTGLADDIAADTVCSESSLTVAGGCGTTVLRVKADSEGTISLHDIRNAGDPISRFGDQFDDIQFNHAFKFSLNLVTELYWSTS